MNEYFNVKLKIHTVNFFGQACFTPVETVFSRGYVLLRPYCLCMALVQMMVIYSTDETVLCVPHSLLKTTLVYERNVFNRVDLK